MPYDLSAAYREKTAAPFEFIVEGETFTLPHMEDVDKRVLAGMSDDDFDVLGLLRLALGDQWDAFDALPLPVRAVEMLYSAWNEHSGVTPGESPASTGSSASTARPSRRTSRAKA